MALPAGWEEVNQNKMPSGWEEVGNAQPSSLPKNENIFSSLPNNAGLAKIPLNILLSYAKNKNIPISEILKGRTSALGRGFTDIGEGAKQAYLEGKEKLGYGKPNELADFNKSTGAERNFYESTQGAQDPINQSIRENAAESPMLAAGGGFGVGGNLLTKMMASAAGAAGAGALKYTKPGESRSTNAFKSGTIGAAARAIPEIPKIAEELTPTSLIARFSKSPLGKEELLRNLEVTKGTQTGLGEVIGSPMAKRLQENVISKIPFTGGNEALQQTGKQILDRGQGIVDKYLGEHDPMDVTDKLGEHLIQANKNATALKNDLYTESNNIADKNGFELKLPNFSDKLQEHGEAILDSNIFQFEPKIKNFVQQIVKGNNAKTPSLKEANIMAGKLSQMAKGYGKSQSISERNAGRVLGDLGRSLKEDIKSEIESSGNKDLKSSFDKAEKNYKENYSDFLEKDLLNYTHGDKLPEDLIASFLKTSNTSDKSGQLEKLMKVLPEKSHDLVRYGYFSRALDGAEGMKAVNPNKLSSLWGKLGDKQKKVLVPDANHRRELDNYSILVGKNQKAVNMMWNPQTGQMNSDLISAIMMAHPLLSLKEIVMGKMGNKLLTGEKARESVVNKIIKRRKE